LRLLGFQAIFARPYGEFPDNFVITYTYDNYEEIGGKKLAFDLFVLAGFISLFTAALPIVRQSLKAAIADPVEALRHE